MPPLNINNLAPGSYSVVPPPTTTVTPPLNIHNLAPDSYTVVPPPPAKQDDFLTTLKNAFSGTIAGVKQTIQGAQQVKDASFGPLSANPAEAGAKTALFGRGALNVTAGALNTLFSPISNVINAFGNIPVAPNETIGSRIQKNGIEPIADVISNAKPLQDFMQTYPHADEVIANLGTIIASLIGAEKAPEIKTAIDESLPTKTAPIENPPTTGTPLVRTPEQTAQLQKVATDWEKPTTINAPAYNNARAVLAKDPTIPQFVADQGLNPFEHVDENGKYDTENSAQNLRDTAAKISRDTLRPSLQQADYTTPPTPVNDILKPSLNNIGGEYAVTAGDSAKIQANVQSEVQALQAKYPEGMSLTDMDDEKITYAKNGGYKPFADAAENNRALANRAISNALADMVEQKVPADIPYADFKTQLAKYYKAADYLDALQGKKAPVSFGQLVARNVAKYTGAKIGGFFGGDLVGEFAGYKIGKALEYMVENLTNPMRDSFLRNLKVTNPEAFAKVSQFLGQQATDAATRLRLPAGSPLGTEKNPIIVPAPKPTEITGRK